jgi:glutamyl-tRNA synthetase
LGWSTSDSKQIFSKEELIEAFSLEGINKANSVFDIRKDDPKFITDPKALSINAHYLRTLPVEEILPEVKKELENAGLWNGAYEEEKKEWFFHTVDLIRSRYHVITDFVTLGRPYFSDDFPMEQKALKKNILKYNELKEWFPQLAGRIRTMKSYTPEESESLIREMAEELNIKAGILINGMRAAVTGQTVGPGLFDVLMAIGQDRVADRLEGAVSFFD